MTYLRGPVLFQRGGQFNTVQFAIQYNSVRGNVAQSRCSPAEISRRIRGFCSAFHGEHGKATARNVDLTVDFRRCTTTLRPWKWPKQSHGTRTSRSGCLQAVGASAVPAQFVRACRWCCFALGEATDGGWPLGLRCSTEPSLKQRTHATLWCPSRDG